MEKKNRYLYYSIFYSCLLLVAIGIYAYGWETPKCDPPGCNLPAPINASINPQTKEGDLTVEGNFTTGSFTMAAGAGENKVLTTNASGVASWQTPASSAPVSSVFGRTGNVTAASGDYSVGNITGAAPLASPTFTGTVSGITKAMVGLGSVDNTADSAKSVLYATTAGSAPKGALSCTTYSASARGAVWNTLSVTCPSGTTCTGGGMRCTQGAGYRLGTGCDDGPNNNGWICLCVQPNGGSWACYARCCKIQ